MTSAQQSMTPERSALAKAVREVEDHMAQRGWDGPVGIFALVKTATVVASDPQFAAMLGPEAEQEAANNPHSLTVVEQDSLPPATDVEDLLSQMAWPEDVDGVAISVERMLLPAQAEQEAAAIKDPAAQQAFVEKHPERQDVRLVAGVLRGGESWCVVRTKAFDDPSALVQGTNVLPGLVTALAGTLS